MQDAAVKADLRHRRGEGRIHVAQQKRNLVAFDQFMRLLHGGPRVAAGRIFDNQFNLAAENSAFSVDLLNRELAARQFVLAKRGIGAGQRVIEADSELVFGARGDDKWAGDLRGA